jgi:hypothetical protein
MAMKDLRGPDQDVIRQCVAAIAAGPFIDDDEFATRLGVSRATVQSLLAAWPHVDDGADDSDACLALNNSMNEVLHGLDIPPITWSEYFTVARREVDAVFHRWARSRGWTLGRPR